MNEKLARAGGKRMRWSRWLLAAVPLSLAACQVIYSAFGGGHAGPVFPHAPHIEEGLECSSCHPGAENSPTAGFPTGPQGCMLCHEEKDKGKPPAKTVAALMEGSWPRWLSRPSSYSGDVKFDHGKHATAQIACATCHVEEARGPEAKAAETKPAEAKGNEAKIAEASAVGTELHIAGGKPVCMSCHAIRHPAGTDCAVCHEKNRKDVRPANHTPNWLRLHGESSRMVIAGTGATTCSQCHAESACRSCHLEQPPADHSNSFRRRGHGLLAAIDRNRCAACHEPDACERCHHETTPMSHRAGWGPPRNNHCLTCHLPPSGLQCGICHKEFPAHPEGPRVPDTPIHARAKAPMDCLGCHVALRHGNPGGNCRSCHR